MIQMGPTCNNMGFPTCVHGPLLQIPYQSHLDYYYGTYIISHVIEKNAINSHVYPHIIKAIHVIHGFWT